MTLRFGMIRRHIQQAMFWFTAAMLVIGNIVMLMWSDRLMSAFAATSMAPVQLQVDRTNQLPTALEVFDRCEGRLIGDWAPPPSQWFDPLGAFLDRRRLAHLNRIGQIAVYVSIDGEEEFLVGTWANRDTWQPDETTDFRYVLAEVLDLPPGRYEVRAMMYADAPWGYGGSPTGEQELNPEVGMRAVTPGEFILRTVTTEPIVIHIDPQSTPRR